MSKIITAPLVGAYHRPPAKAILASLPTAAKLILVPEPENPYDPNAIKVMVDCHEAIPETRYQQFSEDLQSQGYSIEQIMSGGPVQIGYIAASGGKPLEKRRTACQDFELVGNVEVLDAMKDPEHRAGLAFGPDGEPQVVVRPQHGEPSE